MDELLAYFLDLRIRLRGRREAIAIVNRCIRMVASADVASAAELVVLEREFEELRAELVSRFGARAPLRVH